MSDGLNYLSPKTEKSLPALELTFGAHGVKLEVDIETVEVVIIIIAFSFDIGQTINRKLAIGQIVGGFNRE